VLHVEQCSTQFREIASRDLHAGVKESAGKKKGAGSTGHGDPYLARILGEAAVGASKTNTFLGERYQRIARRRGKKKAIEQVIGSAPIASAKDTASAVAAARQAFDEGPWGRTTPRQRGEYIRAAVKAA
jgi:hypothetical protein